MLSLLRFRESARADEYELAMRPNQSDSGTIVNWTKVEIK